MAGRRREADATTRQGRLVAIVIAATGVLWVAAQALVPVLGLTSRQAALIDLIALGSFIWSLAAIWRIWQRRRDD